MKNGSNKTHRTNRTNRPDGREVASYVLRQKTVRGRLRLPWAVWDGWGKAPAAVAQTLWRAEEDPPSRGRYGAASPASPPCMGFPLGSTYFRLVPGFSQQIFFSKDSMDEIGLTRTSTGGVCMGGGHPPPLGFVVYNKMRFWPSMLD